MRMFQKRIYDVEKSLSYDDFNEVSDQVMGKVIFAGMSGSDGDFVWPTR